MKPLWRWTLGPCIPQGREILQESIRKTLEVFGDSFDYIVCYNGEAPDLSHLIEGTPVRLYKQNWEHVPIDENMSYVNSNGKFDWNGNVVKGSFWKVVPPRMRMESHEIVVDNDIIILKMLPQIKEFLTSSKVLLLEEPIRFYGRYDKLFPPDLCFNSGFMGYPPNFDFGAKIKTMWEKNGKLTDLTQADEQGLLTAVLYNEPNIRIKKTDIVEILARDFTKSITGNETGLHFVQSNKIPNHRAWVQYKKLIGVYGK